MKKTCVFCGRPPDKKTREHVIPRWLIEMTGNPKRPVQFGTLFSVLNQNPHVLAADQFVFPACKECNEYYGRLEKRVKPLFENLLVGNGISDSDIVDLLDWFDKIRVGLWLGIRYLDGDPYGIEPRFHISNRIGAVERSLLVYKLDDDFDSMAIAGNASAVFARMPSCLGMRVHGLYFVTISAAGINNRRLGFPFLASIEQQNSELTVNVRSGLHRTLRPVLRASFPRAYHALHQPVMLKADGTPIKSFYKSDYVVSRTTSDGAFMIAQEYPSSIRWTGDFLPPTKLGLDETSA